MLRPILYALRRVLTAMLQLPLRLLGAVSGGRGGAPEPAPFEEAIDDQLEELRDAMEAPQEGPGLAVRTLGERVHAYVSGNRQARPAIALSLIERAIGADVPFSWVAADSVYGVGDIEMALRRAGKG